MPTKKPKKRAPGGKFRSRKRDGATGRVRKNMDMDAAKLAAVKRILGAATETEAVDIPDVQLDAG